MFSVRHARGISVLILTLFTSPFVLADNVGCTQLRFTLNGGSSDSGAPNTSCAQALTNASDQGNDGGDSGGSSGSDGNNTPTPDPDPIDPPTASLWVDYVDNECTNYDGYAYASVNDIQAFSGTWYCEGSNAHLLPPAGPTYFNGTFAYYGAPLNNLSAFSQATRMGLTLYTAPLTSLDGLQTLREGNDLAFVDMPLTSLSPLASLTRTHNLDISETYITSLQGLNGLTTVENDFFLFSNAFLSSLDGLNSLTTAGGIFIEENSQLRDLRGLANLENAHVIAIDVDALSITDRVPLNTPFCNALQTYFNAPPISHSDNTSDVDGPRPAPVGFGEIDGFAFDDVCAVNTGE